MIKAPAFFFPTDTVLVDDDHLYAQLFIDSLENTHRVEIIEENELLDQQDEDFIFRSHRPKNVIKDIETIIKEKKENQNRMVSVIVADLHMKDITGLELFRKLKSPFIYRILISNFADDERFKTEISDAQNAGIIHAVLRKGINLKNELPKIVAKGQQKFFTNLTTKICSNSTAINCLSDTAFSNHFFQLIDEYKPDYIWPDENLSVFIFEKKSRIEKKKLFVTTIDEIKTLLEGENSQSALLKTIEILKTGNFMVCHENPHLLDGEEWAFYLRAAKKISGIDATYLYHMLEM